MPVAATVICEVGIGVPTVPVCGETVKVEKFVAADATPIPMSSATKVPIMRVGNKIRRTRFIMIHFS